MGSRGSKGAGAAHKNQKRRGVEMAAMPEDLLMTGFPFGVSAHQPLSRK